MALQEEYTVMGLCTHRDAKICSLEYTYICTYVHIA